MAYSVTFALPGGQQTVYTVHAADEDMAVDVAIQLFLRPELGLRQLKLREELLATVKIDVARVAS